MKVISFIFFSIGVVATATAANTAGSTTTTVGGHRRTGGIAASLSDSKEDDDDGDDDDATTASIMSRTNVGILSTIDYEGGTCEDEKLIDITDDDDQYDGVSMKDNITIGVVEYGSFCIESIPMSDGATTDETDDETDDKIGVVVDATYVKVMYDCKWDGVHKTYYTCSDNDCSPNSCTPSSPGGTSSSATPWTNYYPTSMQSKRSDDYCYNTTNYSNNNNKDDDDKDDDTGLTSAAIQVYSWKELSTDDDGNEVMARILFDNSCIGAWADYFDDQGVLIVDTGDDDIPEDAVVCEPGANGGFAFCDCHSDCLNYPEAACGCPEAQDCCTANVEEYDVDRNSVPDQYIQCPNANDACDCSIDCYTNKQQCQCEEAQACCHADVNCPDSDPAEHCDCSGDCTNHPDYCTCEEAQNCCADYAAAAADENDDLEAEGGTTDYSDDVDGDDDDDDDDDDGRTNVGILSTFDYEGGTCDEDDKFIEEKINLTVRVLEYGSFCMESIDIDTIGDGTGTESSDETNDEKSGSIDAEATSYTKVMFDCKWDSVYKTYHTCTDNDCSSDSCTPTHMQGTPWTNYYPTTKRSDDYCYTTTIYSNNDDNDNDDVTSTTVHSWKDDVEFAVNERVLNAILVENSCIGAWADYFDDKGVAIVDTGDDDIPEGAVVCPESAANGFAFCDCQSDCLSYPTAACGCQEAQDCCTANVDEYDVDRNSLPDQYIQCPHANDACDCSIDCYTNKQQCQCEEAQACCNADVNCPDSDPAEHCDCSGDCTNHPKYCTCEEAQKCCADYAAAADENDDLEEEEGTTDYSDDVDGDDDDDNDDDGNCQTIEEILCVMGVGDFSVLCSLYTQYVPEPLGTPMTLFAPIDSAFEELTELFGRDITTDPSDLTERIFFFHAMDQPLLYEELECKKLYTMLSGDMSRTTCKKADVTRLKEKFQKGGGNRKNNSLPKIFDADLVACDGSIIHTIDSVMLPNFIMEWTN